MHAAGNVVESRILRSSLGVALWVRLDPRLGGMMRDEGDFLFGSAFFDAVLGPLLDFAFDPGGGAAVESDGGGEFPFLDRFVDAGPGHAADGEHFL